MPESKSLYDILKVAEAITLEALIDAKSQSVNLTRLDEPERVKRFLEVMLSGSYLFARFIVPKYTAAVFASLADEAPVDDSLGNLLARLMEAIRGELFNGNIFGRPGECHSHYRDLCEAYEAAGGDMEAVTRFDRIEAEAGLTQAIDTCWRGGSRDFARNTMACCDDRLTLFILMPVNEGLTPKLYGRALDSLSSEARFDKLRRFLQAHVELDGDDHGPATLDWLDRYIKKTGPGPEEIRTAVLRVLTLYGGRTQL